VVEGVMSEEGRLRRRPFVANDLFVIEERSLTG